MIRACCESDETALPPVSPGPTAQIQGCLCDEVSRGQSRQTTLAVITELSMLDDWTVRSTLDTGDGVLWPLGILDFYAGMEGGLIYEADLTLTVTPSRNVNSISGMEESE